MSDCFFSEKPGTGGEGQSERENEAEEEAEAQEREGENIASFCGWSSSLLHFSGCKATLSRVTIRGITKGALSLENEAEMEIVEGDFDANI